MARKPKVDPVAIPEDGRIWPDWLKEIPPQSVGGRGNPDYYRFQYDRLNLMAMTEAAPGKPLLVGYDSMRRGILEAARMAGVSEQDVVDRRSSLDKAHDLVAALKDTPESALEAMDEELTAVESAMDEAEKAVVGAIDELRNTNNTASLRAASWDERKKRWRSLLGRIRGLRQKARKPVYRRNEYHADTELVQGASHVLRFMAYVGRSDLDSKVFRFAKHHGHMAIGIYCARNQCDVHPTGGVIGSMAFDSCTLVLPPGHGKTEVGQHFMLLAIAQDNQIQALIGHAQGDMAKDIKKKIGGYFETENANARRFLSLFPLKLSDQDNNSNSLRLQLKNPTKSPTIRAHGILSRVNGGNASMIWLDDPCDQDIADQAVQRKRVFNRINGTWLRRLRGMKNTFLLITTTLWHQDDPVSRRIGQARADERQHRKKTQKIILLKCGGPNDKPAFKPLWPAMYPEAYLRKVYKEMANPSLYSAVYRCDPTAEEARIIKKLRFYDPLSKEHQDFMASAIKRLSLDPAATRERKNDRAGMLFLANGQIRTIVKDDFGESVSFESRIRILEAREIQATQTDLVETSVQYCIDRRVDYVHVETRGGYVATAEMFHNTYGIEAIRHDPTIAGKGDRLRACAAMLEDGNAASGIRAVVEFPGRQLPDGTWEPLEEILWVCKQFTDYGFNKDDHVLDAGTQVFIYLASEVGVGLGAQIQRQMKADDSKANRLAVMFKAQREQSMMESGKTGNPGIEEYAWCRANQY